MLTLENAQKESELLNILDEEGRWCITKSGEILTVARSIVHTHGFFHQTANILLAVPCKTEEDEIYVYLQKRSDKKSIFPGAWSVSCGGHMGNAIEPMRSAVREANEELGLEDIKVEDLIPLHKSKLGILNLLKVWKYKSLTFIQMGKDGENFIAPSNDEAKKVEEFILNTPSSDLPACNAPLGLKLVTFNREFCFYYLYIPSQEQIGSAKFKDKEVKGLKRIPLCKFLETSKSEMTDSTYSLIRYGKDIRQTIKETLSLSNYHELI